MNDNGSNVLPSPHGLDAQQAELADRVARNARDDGVHATGIDGLSLIRASSPSQPLASVYHPCFCIVVQGRKRALVGSETYQYDPLNCLVVSMSVPVVGEILEATPARPYLCLRIDLDAALVDDLVAQLGAAAPARADDGRAMFVARVGAPLLDAVLRLVRLIDAPGDAAVLAPLAMREIHYRVLLGELGPRLRSLCEGDGASRRIARAIELLKTHYAQPLRIEDLAAAAHMSASSLHQRFRAATATTPLQFQKQLRLHEARRLMLVEGVEAAVAAHRVGYESPSQFSREYRRTFGAPPRREVAARRAAGER